MRRRTVIVGMIAAIASGAYAATQPHLVGQKGKTFSVKALKVKVDELVVFRNDDNVTHHVYSATKGQEFNLRVMHPGHEGRRNFATPGAVLVQCGLHPGMRLTITVAP